MAEGGTTIPNQFTRIFDVRIFVVQQTVTFDNHSASQTLPRVCNGADRKMHTNSYGFSWTQSRNPVCISFQSTKGRTTLLPKRPGFTKSSAGERGVVLLARIVVTTRTPLRLVWTSAWTCHRECRVLKEPSKHSLLLSTLVVRGRTVTSVKSTSLAHGLRTNALIFTTT